MTATSLVLQPMEWAPLQDIDDVAPIGAADADCLKEVYEVLQRHGKVDRFGVTLLHKHFAMRDDEVLLERTDAAPRSLVLQPAKLDSPRSEERREGKEYVNTLTTRGCPQPYKKTTNH